MKYIFGFDGTKESHAALLQAYKCVLRDGDELYIFGVTNDPAEVEGVAEGFVGLNVEEEDSKIQSSALRKLKKTVKAAGEKTPKKVAVTVHMTSSSNPGENFANAAIAGADALIVGYDAKKGFFGHPSNGEYAMKHSSIPCILIADHAGAEALAL